MILQLKIELIVGSQYTAFIKVYPFLCKFIANFWEKKNVKVSKYGVIQAGANYASLKDTHFHVLGTQMRCSGYLTSVSDDSTRCSLIGSVLHQEKLYKKRLKLLKKPLQGASDGRCWTGCVAKYRSTGHGEP